MVKFFENFMKISNQKDIEASNKEKHNVFLSKTTTDEIHFEKEIKKRLENRRSEREFSSKEVEWEKIYDILEIAFNSPCAHNILSYEVIVVSDKALREKIAIYSQDQVWIAKAKYILVVVKLPQMLESLSPNNKEVFTDLNIGAFTQSIIDGASLYELSSCWVGVYNNLKIKNLLGITNGEVSSFVCIGYPNGLSRKSLKPNIASKIHFEKYNNRERVRIDLPMD